MKNKQGITKIVIVLVVICFGIINGGRQLDNKVEDLNTIFMDGENKDGLSIHYDLTKIDDSLSYFLSLAKLYDVNTDTINSLNSLHKEYQENESIKEYSKWYDEVKDLYPIAIGEVKSENLSDQHKNMLNKYEATFNSAIHTIAYSSFNSSVRKYEEQTDGFLAGLLKTMTGVEGVDTFD